MILRLVLGALFVGMGLGQALSWSEMPDILDAYGVPAVATPPVIAVLIGAEIIAGGWLLARPRSAASLLVVLTHRRAARPDRPATRRPEGVPG